MESFNEKIPMIIAAVIVIALVAGVYYFLVVHKDIYYIQIDNSKIEQISTTDDMKYQYTITGYNKAGNEKEIQFKTNRELREGAYLELEVMLTRGVISWKEVQVEELPDNVKTELNIN